MEWELEVEGIVDTSPSMLPSPSVPSLSSSSRFSPSCSASVHALKKVTLLVGASDI